MQLQVEFRDILKTINDRRVDDTDDMYNENRHKNRRFDSLTADIVNNTISHHKHFNCEHLTPEFVINVRNGLFDKQGISKS